MHLRAIALEAGLHLNYVFNVIPVIVMFCRIPILLCFGRSGILTKQKKR